MIPGEMLIDEGVHTLNAGRRAITLMVKNTSERPILVGSLYHFAETNAGLNFDRAAARGMRLNIASDLIIEVEKDYTLAAGGYGEEVKFGGGKTIRDSMAQSQRTRDGYATSPCGGCAVDTVITNALIIDH